MSMNGSRPARRSRVLAGITVCVALMVAGAAIGQSPPAPSPAKRAVDERKAIYTLIGSNFRPIGEQLQGRASLDATEARRRAERVAFLAVLSSEAYPDVSNVGESGTRAKPEIWARRAQFDAALGEFVKNAQALSQVAATQDPKSDAFRAAAVAVAEGCKGCHDNYRFK